MAVLVVCLLYLVLLLNKRHQVICDENGVSVTVVGFNVDNNSLVNFDANAKKNWIAFCHTTKTNCCNVTGSKLGHWFYPNGSIVLSYTDAGIINMNRPFFLRSRSEQCVKLYRTENLPPDRGRFYCVIPNEAGINQTYYINILDINQVEISYLSPDQGIVGQNFSINCSAHITTNPLPQNTPTPTFEWFYGPNNTIIDTNGQDVTVSAVQNNNNTYVSTLTFCPLSDSHAGIYTCQFGGNEGLVASAMIAVNDPLVLSISISSDPASPVTEGASVELTCTVTFNIVLIEPVSGLSVCVLRDGSPLQLPGGTAPALTIPTVPSTAFNYTIQLDSFGRMDSGNYTCRANISQLYLNTSNILRVTTGVYIKLLNTTCSNNSNILITDIGDQSNALLCFTDLVNCCRSNESSNGQAIGNWFYPNGISVGINSANSSEGFYLDRGPSRMRLHRTENTTSPLGLFCCKVPDATNNVIRTCVNVLSEHNMLSTTTATTIPVEKGQDHRQDLTERSISSTSTTVGALVIVIVILFTVIFTTILVVIFLVRRNNKAKHDRTTQHIAYDDVQEKEESPIEMRQNEATIQIDIFPCDFCVTEGEGVYLKIKVSGVPQPTVTWYHNGETVEDDYAREMEADGSLTIPSVELKHSGVYKAVVANEHGSEEREVKLTVDKEGESSVAVFYEIVATRPITILEFGKYVAELHANSNQPFKDLYQSLDSGEKDHIISYATHPQRKLFNRFGNIVVYDDNRIILKPILEEKECERDYINACYVDGYSITNKFIATQGPLPITVVDFWRLIWQEHPPTIVMVTNVLEGDRIKCEQYWPESGKKQFGPFQVMITDQQIFADYTIRKLSVLLGTSRRSHKVTQFHFTAWPDHGVPDYATSMLAFLRRVNAQHNSSKGPMVVHCSAGIGRTGTFIVIDHVLEQLEKERLIDIPGAITKIRQQRMKMVQTQEQFTFIHDAILESVTCGDTQITATNLRLATAKMKKNREFDNQMKILDQVSPNPEEVQCRSALTYPTRNRGNWFLPADQWRVILKGEQPDYIHAVSVNGYKQKKAFIIAQGPIEKTVRNFWKMVYDRKCAVVVMLSDLVENGEESSIQYWPSSGSYQYREYTVELLGEEPLEGFTIRELSVMDTKTKLQKPRKLTQLHITNWLRDGRCSNLKSITDVIEEMTKIQIRSGNKPIVVHCNDTVTRSGMFCAIATTIERCKTEGVVDVFQVVKALRVQKPGAVPTVDQYKLIFEAVLVFLESFETYANFQNI